MHPYDYRVVDTEKRKISSLANLQLRTDYRTGITDPVREFYAPCLFNSSEYDRAVGFFRSTVYLIVGTETVEFAKEGGKIRLICSPALDSEDLESINSAYA